MYYRRYSPMVMLEEMDRLQKEMNRMFGGYYPGRSMSTASFPAMNVWTGEEGAVVTAEIPGIKSEDLEISVVGNTLTLSGSRASEELPEGARYHRQERGCGKFSRAIELPFTVDADNVEAEFEDGVLQVKLPRSEADKPRKIAVKSI